MTALGLACCGALCVAAGPQARQAQAPGGTFRTSTAIVEVDVVVKDRDGRFVEGLSADDFEVREEGRPQKVEHLYLMTPAGMTTVGARSTINLERPPGDSGRRVFVLFFDAEHLGAASIGRLKNAGLTFVREQFRPGDLGGVFANGTLWRGHLTSDRQELLDGIAAAEPAIETSATRRTALQEFPRIDSEQDAARIDAGDARALESLADLNCTRDRNSCDMEGGREYVLAKLQRKSTAFVTDARRAAARTLSTLSYMSKNLGALAGRKTIVMLSEGFYLPDALSDVPVVTGSAARAGVTIYTIDARGTFGAGSRTFPDTSATLGSLSSGTDFSEDSLGLLAAQTGGLALRHTDDFAAAMAQVASDTSQYYVLTYAPDNAVLDGTFRKIELRTLWKGLTVRARKGYVATPLPAQRSVRTAGG